MPISVGGGEKKLRSNIKEKYKIFKTLSEFISTKKQEEIINFDSIQEILNIYNIDNIYKNVTNKKVTLTQEQLQNYDNYIGLTNDLVTALIENNTEKIKECTQKHCDFVNKIEEEQIAIQASIMSYMKSGKSMISSVNGADSQKMTSSIMSSKSKLMDRGGNFNLTTEQQISIKPQKEQIEITINAFKGLYNNYYNTQKQKTTETEKLDEINEKQKDKNKKIEKNLKASIKILLYPTKNDKNPNPKKEKKSNYDIALENFNNCVADICKKYKAENIDDLKQKYEDTEIEKLRDRFNLFQ